MDFTGYPAPISNYTYTPNQFFDVVLPHFSRGAVRICAYMIRQALGWCNNEGDPHEGQIGLSHSELAASANVSERSVGEALQELIDGRILECLQEPVRSAPGRRGGIPGIYAIRWSSTEYTCKPEEFDGFFEDEGGGHMTRVPDLFFDYTVRHEKLSVIRVVGCILRNTVGYEHRRGFRRVQVQYSHRQIMLRTGITSKDVIADAIQTALKNGHIIEVSSGRFDPDGGMESCAAVYSIHWSDNWTGSVQHPQIERPAKSGADNSKKRGGDRQAEFGADLGNNRGEASAKNGAGTTCKKQSDIKITIPEITFNKKQQQSSTSAINGTDSAEQAVAALIAFGFNYEVAKELTSAHPADVIHSQLEYFSYRTPAQNPQGMLRRAIEQNWSAPQAFQSAAQERLKKERDAEMHRRNQHEQNYKPKYEAYIDALIESIKVSDPEAWYHFEEMLDAEVAGLRDNPALKADRSMLQRMEERFRSPENIGSRARDHFAPRLPAFWEWDALHNPNSYK
ncbi:MAG: hypothetical protein ACYC27_12605 [Armatimonadota bacterium]